MISEINSPGFQTRTMVQNKSRQLAWILILIADGGYMAWGRMAALMPIHLPGPGAGPILPAEYAGFTGNSWSELISKSSSVADFITVLFRMYGAYCFIFGLMAVFITATAFRRGERWAWWALFVGNTIAYGLAITFDRVVNAIGIFELSEYLGIAIIYAALAITAPFLLKRRPG